MVRTRLILFDLPTAQEALEHEAELTHGAMAPGTQRPFQGVPVWRRFLLAQEGEHGSGGDAPGSRPGWRGCHVRTLAAREPFDTWSVV